jgi:PKD repeat protein
MAVDDTITTNEDTPVTIPVLANDTDVDGDANVVTVTLPAIGTALINPDNTITYTPNAEASGTDNFSYTLSDGLFTDTATVTVTITAINDPPIAINDSDTVLEESTVATNVLNNDSDVDGNIDPTTLSIVTGPTNGIAIPDPATGVITYTPNLNFDQVDSYDYQICDDGSPLPSACATATVVITVTAVNDPPIAVDDTANTLEDVAVLIDVLANDNNVDTNDTLAVTAVTQPANGTATINPDSTVTYSPTLNFNGIDNFGYTVSDGVFTDTALVTITVNNVNDIPVVTISAVATPTLEGTPIQFDASINDPGRAANGGGDILWDFGDGTTITGTLTPNHAYADDGPFTVTLTYTDTEGASGSDTLALNIANVPPAVTAGPDQTITLGTAATFNGSFSDPGTLDTHFIQWDLGDGNSVFNTLTPNHSYTNPGTYTVTLMVMDDDNGTGTDQLIVNVVTTNTPTIYLPLILNNTVSAPDLEIQMLAVTADDVTIVIENTGNQAVADSFWVDLYIDPDPVPTGVNQTWDQLSEEGIVWGITDISSLVPGGNLVLNLSHPSLNAALTDFSGIFTAGMEIYVQVDSANTVRPSGGVIETHEILNGPYNNIAHITVQ